MKKRKIDNLKQIEIKMVKKYFFNTDGAVCLDYCNVLNDNTKIGSVNCKKCKFNIDKDKFVDGNNKYVRCSKLKEALK
jgi:hypothetical protein